MATKPNVTKDQYVEALVQTGVWATPQNPIQYAFLEKEPAYLPDQQGFTPLTAAQRAAVQRAFAAIAEVVNCRSSRSPTTSRFPARAIRGSPSTPTRWR